MTADDFFLLFIALTGFVIAPALLLWGLAYLLHGRSGSGSSGSRPDVDSTGKPDGDREKEPARASENWPWSGRRVTAT